MKKLDYNHLTTGALTVDASHLIGVVNDLIDLVNSQQEAIERLQEHVDHEARHVSEPADDKPEYEYGNSITKVKLDGTVLTAPDTHRTVTLRIPKGMTFVESLFYANLSLNMSDNEAKKALDEVKGESNE